MKILLSPCLYCTDEETFNLYLLQNTLDFITNNLDGVLDEYSEAFYSEDRLQPPVTDGWNQFNEYSKIVSDLRKLKIHGDIINVCRHNVNYEYDKSSKFKIISEKEFQHLIDYISQIGNQEYLLFLGKQNIEVSKSSIDFKIESMNINLPVVKDPWIEKSDNFNSYIKENSKTDFPIFVNKELCVKLENLMRNEEKNIIGNLKGSHYKEYGRIIAERNNFEVFSITDPYEPQTDYYKRRDGKYIISVDLIHGRFEVFHGSNELWFAEYSFSGEELYAPTNDKELNKMRQNHRLRRRKH